ncbi:hypothetical protein MKX01_009725, partial [Papaver californicum]
MQSPQAACVPFQILGGEAQIVQTLEKVIAKPGSMCYMSGSIQMDNLFLPENEGNIWHCFLNQGANDGFFAIDAPSLARILPICIDLAMFGGQLLCQPDAFLCSVNDVRVTNSIDQRVRNIVAGPEVVLRQKIEDQGLAFIVAGGSVVQKNLDVSEVLIVDASCIAVMTATINFQIKSTGPIRRMVFGEVSVLNDKDEEVQLRGLSTVHIRSMVEVYQRQKKGTD